MPSCTMFQKSVVPNFCNNFINRYLILKMFSLLETEISYRQYKYNITRHFVKTSLH